MASLINHHVRSQLDIMIGDTLTCQLSFYLLSPLTTLCKLPAHCSSAGRSLFANCAIQIIFANPRV